MLDYFVKVLFFQTLFLIVYDFILKKETFFQWNRFYLLVTSMLAYIIPLIKIKKVAQVLPQEYTILLPEIILSPQTAIKEQFDWSVFLFTKLKWIFWIGIAMAGILFFIKFLKIVGLIRTNEKEKSKFYQLIYLENQLPFSFFNYIFLSKKLPKRSKQQIIDHELVHVRQKHSFDLLFFELQKIIFWFNPFSYLCQQRIAELHEFIADEKSIKATVKANYFQNLLNTTFGTHKISFINPFFKHSLIKKRIVMLNKERSKQLLKFKYLFLLPLLLGMLIYSSCERDSVIDNKSEGTEIKSLTEEEIDERLKTIVKSLESEENDIKRQQIKEEIYFYLLHKREKLKLNGSGAAIDEEKWGKAIIKREAADLGHNDFEPGLDMERIPFAIIEKSPRTLNCKTSSNPKQCFQDEVKKFVNKNYNTSLAGGLNLNPGKTRIYVQFLIDKEGNVKNAKARGVHKALEDEAIRVVNLLPKMEPGEQRGEKVNVAYTIPITLFIQ